jgi:thioredoxin reductase (NADPH)
MERMKRHAEKFGTKLIHNHVDRVELGRRPFHLYCGRAEYTCDALIIATGASAKYLGLPTEEAYRGRGVSACATCDGFFFKDRDIMVVGGGDSAMEEAVFLTKFADKVTIVHRRDEFRASPIMIDRARANDKIEFVTPAVVEEVLAEGGQTAGVRIRDLNTGETRDISAQGLFVAIGHDPNTKLFLDQLDHDAAGYLVTKLGSTETNIEGVFAAGDVVDHTYRQAVTAAGSGCMAALDAERWLAAREGHPATALAAPREG